MNPEDGFRRLNDPDEWNVTLRARPDAVPARRRWAPWAVSLATIAGVAVVGVIVFSVFGLGVQSVRQPAVPALPTNSSTPTPTTTPTPVGTGTPAAAPTCENLLDPDTLADFQSSMQVTDDDYTKKVVDEAKGTNRIGLATFVEYGGIICGWGGMENALMYGFGPITDAQAADVKERIQKKDYVRVQGASYERYDNGTCENGDACGGNSGYAFGDGYWAYFYNNGGGVYIDEIMANGANLAASFPRETPTETPTADPGAEPATPAKPPYLTTEGLGTLRIGQKIPASNDFAIWDPTACSGSPAWVTRDKYGIHNKSAAFEVLTTDRTKNAPLIAVILLNDMIPTKSGVRVGDSLATLEATYPKFDDVIESGFSKIYVIEGTAGKVAFEVPQQDVDGIKANTIASIGVFSADTTVQTTLGTDAWSACGVA